MRLGLLMLMSVVLPVAACPLPSPALQQGAVQAVWKVEGTPIQLGKLFAVEVQVCPANAVLTRVDATMPEHQHGMNYRPSIRRIGDENDGRWRANGLMFHMPGRWEMRFDVQADGRTEKLTDAVLLP
jgi:hypothetical protein